MTLGLEEESSIFSFGSLGWRSRSKCIKRDRLCHLFIGQLKTHHASTNGWPKSAISSKAKHVCAYAVFISIVHLSTYVAHYAAFLLKPTGFNYQGLCVAIAVNTMAAVRPWSTPHCRRKALLLCRLQLPLDIYMPGLADISGVLQPSEKLVHGA